MERYLLFFTTLTHQDHAVSLVHLVAREPCQQWRHLWSLDSHAQHEYPVDLFLEERKVWQHYLVTVIRMSTE